MRAVSFFLCFTSLTALLFSACLPPRWQRIQPGMSKADVMHFVGEPRRRTYEGNFENGSAETWYYEHRDLQTGKYDSHFVKFRDGRVTVADLDQTRTAELNKPAPKKIAKPSLPEVIPPDVGFHCQRNSECRSGNCFDGKCAGPRDCTRPVGADCLTNLDCCSNSCAAGTCRAK